MTCDLRKKSLIFIIDHKRLFSVVLNAPETRSTCFLEKKNINLQKTLPCPSRAMSHEFENTKAQASNRTFWNSQILFNVLPHDNFIFHAAIICLLRSNNLIVPSFRNEFISSVACVWGLKFLTSSSSLWRLYCTMIYDIWDFMEFFFWQNEEIREFRHSSMFVLTSRMMMMSE